MKRTLVVAAFLAAGCVESGTLLVDDDDAVGDDDDATNDPNDQDGDGDPSDTDCDDTDPSVFNGNQEICGDPADNDCDPGTYCYTARVGDTTQAMEPLGGQASAVQFYEDRAIGENGGITRSNAVVVAIYEDASGPNLVFTVDGFEDGSGGFAFASMQGLGGAGLLLVDDAGEGEVNNGNGSFGFQWVECCVDGAVVGPLDTGFCLDFGIPESDGLGNGWFVHDGDSAESMGSTAQVLEICQSQ